MKNPPRPPAIKKLRQKVASSGALSPLSQKINLEQARLLYNRHHGLNITHWPFRRLCYRFGPKMGMWKPSAGPGTIRGGNWECLDQKKLLAFRIP